MALYRRGQFWWVSIHRGNLHIQKSTKLKDKRMARAVEQALCLAGEAVDGEGKRLYLPVVNDEGKKRKLIHGLLQAVYGDDSDRTPLSSIYDEYLDAIKVRGKELSVKTNHDKTSVMRAFVEWAKSINITTLDGVTSAIATKYALKFHGVVSEKRRSNILMNLSSIWNAILSAHPGIVNPWPSVSPMIDRTHSNRVGFTKEEEQRVLEAARQVHEQWYVACVIAKNTGLRYGDIYRLVRGSIDLENGVIMVIPHKTSHSSKVSVRIPMTKELKDVLTDWLARHPRMTKYDKVMPMLKERNEHEVRFRVVLLKAGIDPKKYSFHSWRHALSTRLGETGVSIEMRKKILGHTTDIMAERYNHADNLPEMREALNKAVG